MTSADYVLIVSFCHPLAAFRLPYYSTIRMTAIGEAGIQLFDFCGEASAAVCTSARIIRMVTFGFSRYRQFLVRLLNF